MGDRATTAADAANAAADIQSVSAPVATHTPSPLEQEHVQQALSASETAIDAISTIVSISTWALAIIGVAVALIAFWGWAALKEAARDKAKQIANESWDSYIGGEEFQALVTRHVEKTVEALWQEREVARLQEVGQNAEAMPEFPEPPLEGETG